MEGVVLVPGLHGAHGVVAVLQKPIHGQVHGQVVVEVEVAIATLGKHLLHGVGHVKMENVLVQELAVLQMGNPHQRLLVSKVPLGKCHV